MLCRASIKPTRRRFFQTSSNLSMFPVGLVSDLLVQEVMVACLGKFSFFQKGYLFIYLFAEGLSQPCYCFLCGWTEGRSADRPIDPSTYHLIRSFGIVTTHNLHVDRPMKEAVIILENLLSGKPNLVGKKTTVTVTVTVRRGNQRRSI